MNRGLVHAFAWSRQQLGKLINFTGCVSGYVHPSELEPAEYVDCLECVDYLGIAHTQGDYEIKWFGRRLT